MRKSLNGPIGGEIHFGAGFGQYNVKEVGFITRGHKTKKIVEVKACLSRIAMLKIDIGKKRSFLII